jgi:hypothetical protein
VPKVSRWLAALLVTPALWAQSTETAPRTWEIPALAYGPNFWSTVAITNHSAGKANLRMDVYRETGELLKSEPSLELNPGEMRNIRIEGPSGVEESCWAHLTGPPEVDLDVSGAVEFLRGNAIESYERPPKIPSARDAWVSRASDISNKQVYFLNLAPNATTLTFCSTNRREQRTCARETVHTARFLVKPNQAVAVQVHKLREKFFILEPSSRARAIVLLFSNAPGNRKVFSSKSSVDFGDEIH